MRLLLTADLHFSANPRDAYRHEFIPWLLKTIDKKRVDATVIAGDLTEEKDRHAAGLVNKIVDHLYKVAGACELVLKRGNHDYTSADNPFFQFTRRISNITWVNKPRVWKQDYLLLPHTYDYEQDWNDIDFKAYRTIIAHNTFAGAKNEQGESLRGIPVKYMRGVPTYSGDIHTPQEVGCVTYIGAPYTIDFGDKYQGRVLVLDDQNDTVESIPYNGPQKRLVLMSYPNGPASMPLLNKGDIIKAQIRLDDFAQWEEAKEAARQWCLKRDCVLHQATPIFDREKIKSKRVVIKSRSDEQVLRAYAEARKLDDRTVDVGMQFIEEV